MMINVNDYVCGEPLTTENVSDVLDLVKQIRTLFGNTKTIWLYTGYTFEQIMFPLCVNMQPQADEDKRIDIVKLCDVIVDGRFEKDKADLSYPFAGSTNQRVIDVQKSLTKGEVVLWNLKN